MVEPGVAVGIENDAEDVLKDGFAVRFAGERRGGWVASRWSRDEEAKARGVEERLGGREDEVEDLDRRGAVRQEVGEG